ncbi:MAG: hypothetical protein AVDCRST_MAG68-1245 [uncultured Gemmatimonadetes bacterium]|uniref:Uncharacterized protein n=1 Tax=uncultured Gemmatimonadota bacterium TaxID=203437 RepID=A0A6J4KPK9_9BACT|nr:MAG: hypothetical protein AVDCRST_MAG68-1245 [uncultured Gemmatimonadota bacterium]
MYASGPGARRRAERLSAPAPPRGAHIARQRGDAADGNRP